MQSIFSPASVSKKQSNIPSFIRIKTFRHFGEKNESIEIEKVMMDNQHGDVEIGTIVFSEK